MLVNMGVNMDAPRIQKYAQEDRWSTSGVVRILME